MSDHRVNRPDYADRAVFEALCNALMHRDYGVTGSEIHVDIFDDRIEIYSPGGMPDGSVIQERNIDAVPSKRRNAIIAEIFHRLDYVERRGSGLKKIRDATAAIYGYTDEYSPTYLSEHNEFHVILRNMNYGRTIGDADFTNRDTKRDTKGDTKRDTKRDTVNDAQSHILKLLAGNSRMTVKELSCEVGINERNVKKSIKALKDMGLLVRIGAARGGHWEVMGGLP